MGIVIVIIIVALITTIVIMKRSYGNIQPATGGHNGGLFKIQVAAKEWLASKIVVDFATGKVIESIDLIEGKDWLKIDMTADSYSFQEQPKTNKGGTYYETTISGTSNDIDADTLQILETLRFHEFVVIATDRLKRTRVVGNIDAGMTLQIGNSNENTSGGKLSVALQFFMQSANMAPFCDPQTNDEDDNTGLCDGIENFTDVDWAWTEATEHLDPVLYLLFSGGNLNGSVQVEVYNIDVEGQKIDSTFLSTTMDPGYYGGPSLVHGIFPGDFEPADPTIVRWRKVCAGGAFTAWAQKQITFTDGHGLS